MTHTSNYNSPLSVIFEERTQSHTIRFLYCSLLFVMNGGLPVVAAETAAVDGAVTNSRRQESFRGEVKTPI